MMEIPGFQFVLEDSPDCHQSMTYWNQRSKDVRKGINTLALSLEKYYSSGLGHKNAGDGFSDALSNAARVFKGDQFMEEPLSKFSDAINRIECYREMFLNQTSMLGVQPLVDIAKYIKKAKELKHHVAKANENLHFTWEKFSNIPNQRNLQEPAVLDKAAHTMLNAKENYQKKLAQYIQVLREIHTVKKTIVLQKVLEHMLAQYSFFNFSHQVLKEIEPYMSDVFTSITKQLETFETQAKNDSVVREEISKQIEETIQLEKKIFPDGHSAGNIGASTMHAINASTGRFFTRFSGMIASGVQGVRNKTAKDGPVKSSSEQSWEVIDEPVKRLHSDSLVSRDEQTGFVKSSSDLDDDGPKDSRKSQFYLSIDESSNNVIVKTADEMSGSSGKVGEDGGQQNSQIEKRHNALNEESVVSLTDILEAASQDEMIGRPRADSVDLHFKKGYLRIKQKGTIKTRFPLLYVIVDKKKGNILAQGDDQEDSNLLTNLTLSTVKECDIEETDRNFCFQVITATKDYTFQANSAQSMKAWMQAIQEGVGAALNLSQERIRTLVRTKTERERQARHTSSVVKDAADRIRAVEGNKECADCLAPRPDWASTNLGVIFCIECSGIHRGLGVHISKVRSLTLDRWYEDAVKAMEERGNAHMNKILEAKIGDYVKPTRYSSKEERRKFITAKYADKQFSLSSDEVDFGDELSLQSSSSNNEENDQSVLSETDDDLSLFGSSMHSTLVCLVEGCKECQKDQSTEDGSVKTLPVDSDIGTRRKGEIVDEGDDNYDSDDANEGPISVQQTESNF